MVETAQTRVIHNVFLFKTLDSFVYDSKEDILGVSYQKIHNYHDRLANVMLSAKTNLSRLLQHCALAIHTLAPSFASWNRCDLRTVCLYALFSASAPLNRICRTLMLVHLLELMQVCLFGSLNTTYQPV